MKRITDFNRIQQSLRRTPSQRTGRRLGIGEEVP